MGRRTRVKEFALFIFPSLLPSSHLSLSPFFDGVSCYLSFSPFGDVFPASLISGQTTWRVLVSYTPDALSANLGRKRFQSGCSRNHNI